MYRALTPNEKFQLWNYKFATLLASGKLNAMQIHFIQEIKNNLSSDLFTNNSNLKMDAEKIKNEGIQLFGVTEAFKILADINGAKYGGINSRVTTEYYQKLHMFT